MERLNLDSTLLVLFQEVGGAARHQRVLSRQAGRQPTIQRCIPHCTLPL